LIETGRRNPNAVTRKKLAAVLGCEPHELAREAEGVSYAI
jgi:hypothetical protein